MRAACDFLTIEFAFVACVLLLDHRNIPLQYFNFATPTNP